MPEHPFRVGQIWTAGDRWTREILEVGEYDILVRYTTARGESATHYRDLSEMLYRVKGMVWVPLDPLESRVMDGL